MFLPQTLHLVSQEIRQEAFHLGRWNQSCEPVVFIFSKVLGDCCFVILSIKILLAGKDFHLRLIFMLRDDEVECMFLIESLSLVLCQIVQLV